MSEGGDLDVKRCAKCAAWIPFTATMCAYCNTTTPDEPLKRTRGSVLSLRHGLSATNVLIAANVAYFVFSLYVQYTVTPQGNPLQWATTGTGLGHGLYFAGAYHHAEAIEQHEWWRVLCATFLHIGGIHIAMNMLALKQLGGLAEGLFGPAKFLTVYVISGVCSSLAISVWYVGIRHLPASEFAGVAGASGAIFGVAGLLIAYLLRAGTTRGREIAMSIAQSVAMMLVIGLVVPKLLSQVGHVGGLLPGLACGALMKDEFSHRMNPASRAMWSRVASLCVAAAVVSLLAGAWFAYRHLGVQ